MKNPDEALVASAGYQVGTGLETGFRLRVTRVQEQALEPKVGGCHELRDQAGPALPGL